MRGMKLWQTSDHFRGLEIFFGVTPRADVLLGTSWQIKSHLVQDVACIGQRALSRFANHRVICDKQYTHFTHQDQRS